MTELGYRWFRGASADPAPEALGAEGDLAASRELVYDFVRAAPAELGTDPQRVLLFGFSQGATVTWTCLLGAWPTTTAAAANGHGGG